MEQVIRLDIERDGVEPSQGSTIPSNKWFKRKDDDKKYWENLRKDDDKWYEHLQRMKEFEDRQKENYYY